MIAKGDILEVNVFFTDHKFMIVGIAEKNEIRTNPFYDTSTDTDW